MNPVVNRDAFMKMHGTLLRSALQLSLFLLLMTLPAFALLEVQTVTPDSTEESGMTLKYQRAKDGTYTFTVTRYPARELLSWPGARLADLEFHDAAELEIRTGDQSGDQSGDAAKTKLLAKTRVASEEREGTRIYVFSLARECIAHSRFTVYENVQHKDATQLRRLGGSLFEVNLAEIDRRLKAAVPLHP